MAFVAGVTAMKVQAQNDKEQEGAMVAAYKPRGIFGQAIQKAKASAATKPKTIANPLGARPAAPQQGMMAGAIKAMTSGQSAPKDNFFTRAKTRAQGK